MTLLQGINHAAIVTANLSRFIDFYASVFEADVIFQEQTPELCHAMLRIGPGTVLHAVEAAGSAHAAGVAEMFGRGHLDHLGLNVASREALEELRQRLLARGASDGVLGDLGPQLSFWFRDPDGMLAEVCWIRDPELRGFHAPEPLTDGATPAH